MFGLNPMAQTIGINLTHRIKRLEELEDKIAESPWDFATAHPDYDDAEMYLFYGETETEHGEFGSILATYRNTLVDPDEGTTFSKEDLEYIAHARTVIPVLLKLLREKGVEL